MGGRVHLWPRSSRHGLPEGLTYDLAPARQSGPSREELVTLWLGPVAEGVNSRQLCAPSGGERTIHRSWAQEEHGSKPELPCLASSFLVTWAVVTRAHFGAKRTRHTATFRRPILLTQRAGQPFFVDFDKLRWAEVSVLFGQPGKVLAAPDVIAMSPKRVDGTAFRWQSND